MYQQTEMFAGLPFLPREKRQYIKRIHVEIEAKQYSIFDLLNEPIFKGKFNEIGRIYVPVETEEDVSDFKTHFECIPFLDAFIAKAADLHSWVLEESLTALKGVNNPHDKLEVLEWIFAPSYLEQIGKDANGHACVIRRHTFDIPFSFANCCRAQGVDPDEFREMLLGVMTDKLRAVLEPFVFRTCAK
jgi:hypothetical protein